jgi:VanZ family protein
MVRSFPVYCRLSARLLFVPALAIVVWGELRQGHGGLEIWDKALHFIAYFGLAAIATVGLNRSRPAILAAIGLAGFGGALEIAQSFVGRDAEWGDELANILGVCSGLATGLLVVHVAERLARGRHPARGGADGHVQ